MVGNTTSLTGNGLRDWLLQRFSALVIGLYIIILLAYFWGHPGGNYETWVAFQRNRWMEVFSFVVVLNIIIHAWVGVWTVLTDYVKCRCLRLAMEGLVFFFLLGLLGWGIAIIWGNIS